jgi:hypothetical protein
MFWRDGNKGINVIRLIRNGKRNVNGIRKNAGMR